MIGKYFEVINQLSVGLASFAFMCLWARQVILIKESKMEKLEFGSLASGSLSVATLPTGIALILCAFDTSLLPKLSDLHLHIWIAGAAIFFLGITAFISEWNKT